VEISSSFFFMTLREILVLTILSTFLMVFDNDFNLLALSKLRRSGCHYFKIITSFAKDEF
jgi:hypothetical protein